MRPRHRLDIGVGDLRFGLGACLVATDTDRLEAGVLRTCGLGGQGLVTLSVRSGWDLLLGAWAWPAGDEVIIRRRPPRHGRATAGPRAAGCAGGPGPGNLGADHRRSRAGRSLRTRAVLVAQLFRGRADLGPLAAFAVAYGLVLVEDAAQACTGPTSLRRRQADVSLYSFGPIKTASAAGGAVVLIGDPDLLAAVRRVRHAWPVQSRTDYAARLLRVAALRVLERAPVYGAYFAICALLGLDPDRLIAAATDQLDDRARGGAGLWLQPAGPATAGYVLAPIARGRGLATDALHALTTFAWTLAELDRVELFVEPWNVASVGVAERCGYVRQALLAEHTEIGGRARDMLLLAIGRP